jgi:hypothetical protein
MILNHNHRGVELFMIVNMRSQNNEHNWMLIGFVCASSCVVGTKVLQRTFEIAVRF